MQARDAEGQFIENVRLFGNPQNDPEKYNLYMGLANLAREINHIRQRIDELAQRMERVERR